MTTIRRVLLTEALRSWHALNQVILTLTEAELTKALELERANAHRAMVLRRLHQRLSVKRRVRERQALLR
jgi:hypothetical protein